MQDFRGKYTVKEMCAYLKISESGYYRWLKNRNKPTFRQLLSVEILKVLEEHPDNDNYGTRRMRIALQQRGMPSVYGPCREPCRKWGCCTKIGFRMG